MSGGHWNYIADRVADELFSDNIYPHYGDAGFRQSAKAARKNPLEDAEMSEMIWDMLCVIHAYEWYASGDISEERYLEDVKRFKEKWLGLTEPERVKRTADAEIERVKYTLYKTFGLGRADDG